MTEIKAAVANATEFAKSLLHPARADDIRLEEVDSSMIDGGAVWLITLSNPTKTQNSNRLFSAIGADTSREYRVFTVLKASGEVVSMKIRLFATP